MRTCGKSYSLAVGITVFLVSTLSFTACRTAELAVPNQPAGEESQQASNTFILEGIDYVAESDITLLTLLKEMDSEENLLLFDEVEWIDLGDQDRIDAIGINPDVEMPGGFYVYNASEDLHRIPMDENVEVLLLNWDDLSNHLETDLDGLAERMEAYESLYHLTIESGRVTRITEQYTP